MAPRKNLVESDPVSEGAHVFTEYAGDCGHSWPIAQGDRCPECGEKGYLSEVA